MCMSKIIEIIENYRKRKIERYPIDPSSEFHQNIEQIAIVEDDNIFQFPLLSTDTSDWAFGYNSRIYNSFKFEYANSEKCGCHYDYDDSLMINTDEYRRIHSLRTNKESCSTGMEDHECLYELRKTDRYDLAIQNAAQNGCNSVIAICNSNLL